MQQQPAAEDHKKLLQATHSETQLDVQPTNTN
jgi:hypothetical protein